MVAIRHEPVGARDAEAARTRLAGSGVIRTPLVPFGPPSRGRRIHLKLENLQPIGSFKLRGMWNAISAAEPEEIAKGVWTLSAGNAAQGLAWSARRLGVECRVVVPDNAPRSKLDAVERLGGVITRVPIATWFELAATRVFAGVEGQRLVHPFSDPWVMAGNATIALEILEDEPNVQTVLVPWGGGGLCCGIASVIRELAPNVGVYGCEFSPTAPLRAALDAGHAIEVPYVSSFIDGIGAPHAFPEMLDLGTRLGIDALVSTIDEVTVALREVAAHNHVLIEGAAAVPVAAAMRETALPEPIVCVVSGGNIDLQKVAGLLSTEG
jgi:threonine dehydratase